MARINLQGLWRVLVVVYVLGAGAIVTFYTLPAVQTEAIHRARREVQVEYYLAWLALPPCPRPKPAGAQNKYGIVFDPPSRVAKRDLDAEFDALPDAPGVIPAGQWNPDDFEDVPRRSAVHPKYTEDDIDPPPPRPAVHPKYTDDDFDPVVPAAKPKGGRVFTDADFVDAPNLPPNGPTFVAGILWGKQRDAKCGYLTPSPKFIELTSYVTIAGSTFAALVGWFVGLFGSGWVVRWVYRGLILP